MKQAASRGNSISAAGGVVYCVYEAQQLILLIRDKYEMWTLPKGHAEAGESEEETAYREIYEETGLSVEIGALIERVNYPVYKKHQWRNKVVSYYLATSPHLPPTPRLQEGISAAEWVGVHEALHLIGYAQVREVLRKAIEMIDDTMRHPES